MPSNPFTPKNPYSISHQPDTEDLLYPVDNPDFARSNALQDIGHNPYAANPFTQSLRRLAPALQNTYKFSQAARGTANTPQNIANRGMGGRDSSMTFSDYLRFNLTGASGTDKYSNPDYASPMQGPQQQIRMMTQYVPQMGRWIRGYRDDLGAGRVNFQNLNPFMAGLSEQWGANGGLGTADFISQMMSPLLSPNMASAYSRALRTSGEQAIRRLADEGIGSKNDIWTYLLGV